MLKCQDYFMLRTPSLPLEYLAKYEKQEKDIYEFILEDEYLYHFFQKALFISSKSTYHSFIHKPTDEKKYRDLKESLLKYFIRSIMRATPYGYMSGVSIGKFSDKTKLCTGDTIIDVQVDNAWLYAVIHKLEGKQEIYRFLKYKFNSICYVSGERLVNPYYTNSGMASEKDVVIKENNIRYTKLIRLIQELAQDFIPFYDLQRKISEQYPEVPIDKIESTLCTLIENEIILSNLRIPVYCMDHLGYVIDILEICAPNCQELEELKLIRDLITDYKHREAIRNLERAYTIMEKLHKSNNYIVLNKGDQLLQNYLSLSIKKKVENVMNVFYQMPLQMNPMRKFIDKFTEEYGLNVCVPLLEIIDRNGFNGTELVSTHEVKETETERKLENILRNKIFLSILNGQEEVKFTKNDFKDLLDVNLTYPKDCDINFILSKNKDEYQLFLAPCGGSSQAGSMLQRFSRCFDEKNLNEYNQIYEKVNDIYRKEYVLVEAREYSTDGRVANVLNDEKHAKYYIAFGNTSKETSNELYLKDISVGLTRSNRIFLYSETLKTRIKVIQNNMLNSQLENAVIKLLLAISEQEEYFPENRMMALIHNIEYKYVPRIKVEDVVISTKRWFLNEDDLQSKDILDFTSKIRDCIQKYKIDYCCYSVKADNRIIVNLDTEESIRILYKTFQKTKQLTFHELEDTIENLAVVEDKNGSQHMAEFVFSLLSERIDNSQNRIVECNNRLDRERRENILFEEGWVYFKLYGMGEKENEVLSRYLPELLECLNQPKHFFIRYYDSIGQHLRIRIKFKNSEDAVGQVLNITNWAKNMIDQRIIDNIVFDTYKRENNRYGGSRLIEAYEAVFFDDSVLVEKMLSASNFTEKENLDKCYMSGITYFLMQMSNGLEDMLQKIDNLQFDGKYRKEYRENSRKYIEMVSNTLNQTFVKDSETELEMKQIGLSLISYKRQLEIMKEEGLLTNDLDSIIFSVIHMHCNRLTGNRLYEEKYLEIVRNTLYHIVKSIRARKQKEES